MKTELSEYDKQAEDFLQSTGSTIKIEFSHNGKHFDSDTQNRDIYNVTLSRKSRSFTFKFGQSTANSTKYVLKNNPGEEFTTDGGNLTGRLKALTTNYLETYCKKVNGTPPTAYSILSCLTKYDPGTFEDFCAEFGYDEDSRTAEKTYRAVLDEYKNLCTLFTDEELEQLQEIQ